MKHLKDIAESIWYLFAFREVKSSYPKIVNIFNIVLGVIAWIGVLMIIAHINYEA